MPFNQLLSANPVTPSVKFGHDYLINLIKIGDLASIQTALAHHLTTYGKDFFTSPDTNFVLVALNEDQIEIADYILEKFIEEKMDKAIWMVVNGQTVLSLAARKNSEKIVKRLTAYATDPTTEPVLYFQETILPTTVYEIDSPLAHAVANKNKAIIQLLLQKMLPDVLLKQMLFKQDDQTLLHNPNIKPKIFAILLQAISQLSFANRQIIFSATDRKGNTSLHIACQTNQLNKAKLLLYHGASLLNVNSDNQSAIANLSPKVALTMMTYANRLGSFIGGRETHSILQKATIPILTLIPHDAASNHQNINLIGDTDAGTIFYTNSVRVYQVMQACEILAMWLQKEDRSNDKEWLSQTLKNYHLNEDQLYLQLQFIDTLFSKKKLSLNQQIKDGIHAMLIRSGKQAVEQTSTGMLTTQQNIHREQQTLVEAFFAKLCRQQMRKIFPELINFAESFSNIMSKLKKEREFAEYCCVSIKQHAEARLLISSKSANKNIELFLKRLMPSLTTLLLNILNDRSFLDQLKRKPLREIYKKVPEGIKDKLPELSAYLQGDHPIEINVGLSTEELNINRIDLFNFKQNLFHFKMALNLYDQQTWQGRFAGVINNNQGWVCLAVTVLLLAITFGGLILGGNSAAHWDDDGSKSEEIPFNRPEKIGGSILTTLGFVALIASFCLCTMPGLRSALRQKILNSGYWNHNTLEGTQETLSLNDSAFLHNIIENVTSLAESLPDDAEVLKAMLTTTLSILTNSRSNLRTLITSVDEIIHAINNLQNYINTQQQTISWQHRMFQPAVRLEQVVVEEPTEGTRLLAFPQRH